MPLKWVPLGTQESLCMGRHGRYRCLWYGRNVLRIGSYILSSFLQLGFKQRLSSDFCNQRYFIGVIDTGCICRVMRLPPGDYCNSWLGMGDDKILGGGSIQMGLQGDKFLKHGACLVLSSPLEMGGFWRSPAAHPRQNLVQYPTPTSPLPQELIPLNTGKTKH